MADLLDLIVENHEKVKLVKKELNKKAPKKVKEKKKVEKDIKSDEEDYEIEEPSLQEITESNKILLKIAEKETVRSKKRKIYETQVETKKAKTKSKIEEYLQIWKEDREKFKYQKARQIYIQKFLFDDSKISEDIWLVTLEYCGGIQGNGKQMILENARKIIDDLDSKTTKTEQESMKYRRAREILQNLA